MCKDKVINPTQIVLFRLPKEKGDREGLDPSLV